MFYFDENLKVKTGEEIYGVMSIRRNKRNNVCDIFLYIPYALDIAVG